MPKPISRAGPFKSVFQGFAEIFTSFRTKKELKAKSKKPSQTELMKLAFSRKSAEDGIKKTLWTTYNHFKQQHNMLYW